MRLKSCRECGVVVDLEKMDDLVKLKDIGKLKTEEEFEQEKNNLNTFVSDEDHEEEGFHCPCCKKWVSIFHSYS